MTTVRLAFKSETLYKVVHIISYRSMLKLDKVDASCGHFCCISLFPFHDSIALADIARLMDRGPLLAGIVLKNSHRTHCHCIFRKDLKSSHAWTQKVVYEFPSPFILVPATNRYCRRHKEDQIPLERELEDYASELLTISKVGNQEEALDGNHHF